MSEDQDRVLDVRRPERVVDLTRHGRTCVETAQVGEGLATLEGTHVWNSLGREVTVFDGRALDIEALHDRGVFDLTGLPLDRQRETRDQIREIVLLIACGADGPVPLSAEAADALLAFGFNHIGWDLSPERAAPLVRELTAALERWYEANDRQSCGLIFLHDVELAPLGDSEGWRLSFPQTWGEGNRRPVRVFATTTSRRSLILEQRSRYEAEFREGRLGEVSALHYGGGAVVLARTFGGDFPSFEPFFRAWRYVDAWHHELEPEGVRASWDRTLSKFESSWEGYPRREDRYELRPLDLRELARTLADLPRGTWGLRPARRASPRYAARNHWYVDELGLSATDLRAWAKEQRWRRAFAVIDEWNDRVLFGETWDGIFVVFTFATGE